MNRDIHVCDQVRDVRSLYTPLIRSHPDPNNTVYDFLWSHADILWNACVSQDPRINIELSNYHPQMLGGSTEEIMSASFERNEIELVVLKQYGFSDWNSVRMAGSFNIEFEHAVNHLLNGALSDLRNVLEDNHGLAQQKSVFGHRSGMIHYLGSNGVEIWRQIVPENAVDILQLLLRFGADPNQPNHIYGGSDLKSLIETSSHPYEAGCAEALLETLEIENKREQ